MYLFPLFQVLIADDYSDPFDAKSEVNKMGKGENTGYMEPYEAQRIMTGKTVTRRAVEATFLSVLFPYN